MGFSTSTYYQARPSPLSSRMTVHFAYATSRLTALLHRPLTSACAHTHQAGKTEHTALADEGAPLSHNLSWTLDHPEQTWKEIPGERCVVRVRVRVARRELRAQMYPERAPGGVNVSRLASRPLSTIHSYGIIWSRGVFPPFLSRSLTGARRRRQVPGVRRRARARRLRLAGAAGDGRAGLDPRLPHHAPGKVPRRLQRTLAKCQHSAVRRRALSMFYFRDGCGDAESLLGDAKSSLGDTLRSQLSRYFWTHPFVRTMEAWGCTHSPADAVR
jgi:hypothetical protein